MKKVLSIVLLCLAGLKSYAQESEKPFKVEIHGFVSVNAFYDSRQSSTARNGNVFIFPRAPQYDVEGNDLNARSSFDLDASLSRVNFGISGPDILGARTFAFIEGDFLGDKAGNDVTLRLRHAFVRLNWEKTSLLVGEYWHPLFLTENYPNTVTLSAGTPYHPLNRQPQIRLAHKLTGQLEVLAFLMTQNDFSDRGMFSGLQNSARPEVDLQAKYTHNNFFAALTAGYKTLRPHLQDPNTGLETREMAKSAYVAASVSQKINSFMLRAEAVYGGGMTNQVLLGGFAEKDNSSPEREYTPIRTLALWTDLEQTINKWQPGLFIGYTRNCGTAEDALFLDQHTLGGDIAHMYSLTPRLRYNPVAKISLGVEWMYTVAAYGSERSSKLRPITLEDVSNSRTTASIRYTF